MVEETSSKASEYPEWMPLRALDLIQSTLLQNVLEAKAHQKSTPGVSENPMH